MSSVASNKKLIDGIFAQQIPSKTELQSTAKAVCDSNTVSLNMLPLITNVLDSIEGKALTLDDERRLYNAQSSFKTLQETLLIELKENQKLCQEAGVAVKVLIHCYYHNPQLLEDAEKMNKFIFAANEAGILE